MPLDPIAIVGAAKTINDNSGKIERFINWIWSKRYPKAKKNRIGVAIIIVTDSSINREIVKYDFIKTIENLALQSKLKKPFHVIDLPEKFAEKIKTPEDQRNLLVKCNCQFLIHGIARQRTFKKNEIDKEISYVLDLGFCVLHDEVREEISNLLSNEMDQLLPARRKISNENDLTEFELNAANVHFGTKYVIASALYISKEVDLSIEIFDELNDELKKVDSALFPEPIKQTFKILKIKVILTLAGIYLKKASHLLQLWRKTYEIKFIDEMAENLKKSETYLVYSYQASLMWAIYYFVKDRDIKLARKQLIKWKKNKITDASGKFSEAFLFAYEGKLQESEKLYKASFKKDTDSAVLLEIEQFLTWLLSIEPHKIQFYFCRGLINYFGLQEYKHASEDFSNFLSLSQNSQFNQQRNSAIKYLQEIKSKT